jgi:small conductance mechanosensitive channel
VAGARDIFASVAAFLPLLMVALVVLAFFWIIGVLLTRSSAIFGRLAPNPLVRTLIGQIVRLAFIVVGLVLAMRIMGATTLLGSVLGAAGVIGLAVGFAIRDTIENYIASILLSIRRPFAPNDLVILEGHEGRVTRLNSRATFLTTPAGNEVRIPNALVYKAKIENYTAIPERRFEFKVGIGYENDLCEAIAIAYRAVFETQGVMADPEPSVIVDALGDSTVVLIIRGWTDQGEFDFQKVKSVSIRSVKEAFDAHDISMPEPIQNVRTLRDRSKDRKPKLDQRTEPVIEAATDTSPDRTIEGKVAELRSGAEEDLLSSAAPRE